MAGKLKLRRADGSPIRRSKPKRVRADVEPNLIRADSQNLDQVSPVAIFRTKADALSVIGGLSKTSKMPGPSYSTSALDCQTGSKLRLVPNSVCSKCYARKGSYVWPNVYDAHARNMSTIVTALADDKARAQWVAAMASLLVKVPHFRWHDSGDLQSPEHFGLICDVARATPSTRHWLPTKEPRYVKRYRGEIPSNLIVRVSGPMIDGGAPQGFPHTSSVHKAQPAPQGSHVCPSSQQGGKCGDCRACWSQDVANVSYPAH